MKNGWLWIAGLVGVGWWLARRGAPHRVNLTYNYRVYAEPDTTSQRLSYDIVAGYDHPTEVALLERRVVNGVVWAKIDAGNELLPVPAGWITPEGSDLTSVGV